MVYKGLEAVSDCDAVEMLETLALCDKIIQTHCFKKMFEELRETQRLG